MQVLWVAYLVKHKISRDNTLKAVNSQITNSETCDVHLSVVQPCSISIRASQHSAEAWIARSWRCCRWLYRIMEIRVLDDARMRWKWSMKQATGTPIVVVGWMIVWLDTTMALYAPRRRSSVPRVFDKMRCHGKYWKEIAAGNISSIIWGIWYTAMNEAQHFAIAFWAKNGTV